MNLDPICDLTAVALHAEIAAGHVSAREVVQAHLDRIAHCNPQVNAIVTLDAEGALRQAALADEAYVACKRKSGAGTPLGLLHGLPVAHKDTFLTAGMRTTWGSPIYRDFVPQRDSLVVTRQRQAGAITLGKTNMPEFGAGSHTFNPVFGATRNPYDVSKSAGGSSGGAAAALACRMVALADGSDMGGSLRNPASFCNVVGLRPSPGRVPQWPASTPWHVLGVAGPMGRSVADVALYLAALAGEDRRDPLSLAGDPAEFLRPLARDFAGVRVAFAGDWGGLPTDPQVLDVVRASVPVLRDLGCLVEEACPDFSDAAPSFHALRGLLFAVNQAQNLATHRDQIKDTVVWNIELGLTQPGSALVAAERARAALFERMHTFMQTHEFLVGVVSQVPPFALEDEYVREINGTPMADYIDWMRSAYYLSLTGHPAISVPCGFTPAGLPVGLHIVGRYRDERGVLQLAHAFEQATKHGWRLPGVLAGG